MPTALVVTADLGGNLPPVLGLARELRNRGWTVVVHADSGGRTAAEAAGLESVAASGVAYDATEDRSTGQSLRDIPRLWGDRSRGRDAVEAARRIGADVVLVDVLFVGALHELQRAGIRTVALGHSSWEGIRTFFAPPIGALLRLRGTAPAKLLGRADRVLVTSDERLGRRLPMPPNARTTGVVLQEPPRHDERSGRSLVLVSLSTVAFPGQRETLQRVLDAVAPLEVEVAASSGRAVDPASLRAGGNTTIERSIDHAELLPRAAAIVSHGGHATTVRALSHGVPMLVLPMHPMLDQPRIGAAVQAAGAGLTLPKTAEPERIRSALQRLLREPEFRVAAERLGADLVAADGARRAADEVAAVVAAVAA